MVLPMIVRKVAHLLEKETRYGRFPKENCRQIEGQGQEEQSSNFKVVHH
jgi:hypothetical protein